MTPGIQAWRAAILYFDARREPRRIDDGLLVVQDGTIVDLGDFAGLHESWAGVDLIDWRGLTLAPGFVDIHVHFPQFDVIGSPADGLLPWLEHYTFPAEAAFADPAHAAAVAPLFLDELLRHGVTTAMVYGSSHPVSVDALFAEARARRLRMIAGKTLMDQNCPDGVRDRTEQSLLDTEALIRRWHGVDRLGYALTPRFVPSCSEAQMRGCAALADSHPGVWTQTHVAENRDEIAWVARLYPSARSYLDVYERMGLLRPRGVFGHCIWLDDEDRARLRAHDASAAVCPTSNLFLGSGLYDFAAAGRAGLRQGLASDVGGGSSFSPFRTMMAAYEVARLRGVALSPSTLWRLHTLDAARAIDLEGRIGNLAVGADADFIALDPGARPLLARRAAAARSLDEWLFAMIVLADDRAIRHVVVDGECRRVPA
ncbi:MAG: guanine deaminase [Burkholderiaceae bacterium]